MKNKFRLKKTIAMLGNATIIALYAFIFWLVWNNCYWPELTDPFFQKGTLLFVVAYTMMIGIFSALYSGFSVGVYKVTDIIVSHIISLVLVNVITYIQISLIFRGLVDPFGLFVLTAIEVFVSIIWALITNKLYFKINPPKRMMVVYGNENVDILISKMKRRKDKYNIAHMISIDEGLDAIMERIVDFEAVLLYDVESPERNSVVKYCYQNSIRLYITPKLSDIIVGTANSFHLFDSPLLVCRNKSLNLEQEFFKRILDVVISVIMTLITSPIMLLTALIIKISDRGPVFYKQTRLTINDKEFSILKFRSMRQDAEKDGKPILYSQNDDRVTAVGKVIRKLRIDELPQFFNILSGDMSVVGPRPERPELAKQYCIDMPEFAFRTKVKAGLTGYAQVLGRYNTAPYDKLKLDVMYIQRYSLFFDVKIILMTIKTIFMKESTEGVTEKVEYSTKKTSEKNRNKKKNKIYNKDIEKKYIR